MHLAVALSVEEVNCVLLPFFAERDGAVLMILVYQNKETDVLDGEDLCRGRV